MRWFGCDHFLLKGLEKVRIERRFTPKVFGVNDAGLQPQTGVEPGELRKTHVHPSQNCLGGRGGGGGESAANGLKLPGRAFFAPSLPDARRVRRSLLRGTPTAVVTDSNFRKNKSAIRTLNRRSNFFFATTRAALAFSHSLSPEPTAVGRFSSAIAVRVAGRRWLSFLR
jgi:hypothetical protein